MKGKIARFNAKRGYGFIESSQLEKEIFVHITKIDGRRALRPGQQVVFDVEETDKGPAAVNVKLSARKQQGGTDNESSASSSLLVYALVALVLILAIIFILL